MAAILEAVLSLVFIGKEEADQGDFFPFARNRRGYSCVLQQRQREHKPFSSSS
uniref:Uncharacterized protein n=1 Tax=Anguilla anguilla TaxID=7936 RepID=A0A0E9SZ28_ANGAN